MKYFSDLANKNIVVTGGGRGIGKDIASVFAEHGARVIICGRNVEALKQTAEELRVFNPGCTYLEANLLNVMSIGQMMANAIKIMGSIDILVNNAGINIPKPALDVTEEDWDNVIDTNLKAAFFCSQSAGKYMVPQGKGKIINIASQMAFVGYRERAAYCSSKGGMVQLTKALAIEWAPHGINVNAVAPTFINTEFTEQMFMNKEFTADVFNRIPLGRLADKSDVSAAVLFLSSDLSGMITGETIKVDGGWTAI